MSLVLDALRRQQAEQEPGAAVTLALAAEHRHRQHVWMGVLAVALTLNAAVLAWIFLGRDGAQSPGADPAALAVLVPSEAATLAADAPVPAAPAPAPDVATTPAPAAQPATTPVTVAPAPPAAPLRVIVERLPLDALPSSVRARLPGIAFSTHVYAADPSQRNIVANGERLQEGESVRGLLIREITETGVVIEFENYLVEVPVFTEW
jgi:type IV secretory pathway VirB10-like protein